MHNVTVKNIFTVLCNVVLFYFLHPNRYIAFIRTLILLVPQLSLSCPSYWGGIFFSNLQCAHLRINSFSWHNRVYHPIVCGAEQNRPTLNENTSELEDTRAQLVSCCFF